MIRIDRSATPEPPILGREGPKEIEKGRRLYAEDPSGFRQRADRSLKAYRDPSVRAALQRLFHSKCVYCETRIGAGQGGDIEQFRPKGGVLAADGSLLAAHYFWLANTWSNLYLACVDCNRRTRRRSGEGLVESGKGGRFPLEDEAQRAEPFGSIERERPMLLDPCNDPVEEHLVFSTDGLVQSTTGRGLATIEILGLNRAALVRERRNTAETAFELLQILVLSQGGPDGPQINDTVVERLVKMQAPDAAYAGMCRQVVRAELEKHRNELSPALMSELGAEGSSLVRPSDERRAKAALVQFRRAQEDYSLEAGTPESFAAYTNAADRRCQRVTVRDLRAIRRLSFEVTDQGGRGSWTMFLGENATGKSTILQALALALVGDAYRDDLVRRLDLDLGRMVRSGAPYGEIAVHLSSVTEPRVLRLYPNGRIETRGRAAQLMTLAYGSTRLLPRRPDADAYGEPYARVDNLFDPFRPLVDAQHWLLQIDEERFDFAARAIKRVLNLADQKRFVRAADCVGLEEGGELIPLARLCDGYQTVIALVADILEVVLRAWSKPELAQGLVLIDEVGNHLHPSWKIRFVQSLRDVLPGIQVIATTHEPLCLRGMRQGEVAVLRRGPRGAVHVIDDLPSIEGLRVDQILTSPHFGLESTLDPEMQGLFDEYQRLLRVRKPTPAQQDQIKGLRDEINRMQGLGNTERERRMLGAIDRSLARQVEVASPTERRAEDGRLDAELDDIWAAAAAGAPAA